VMMYAYFSSSHDGNGWLWSDDAEGSRRSLNEFNATECVFPRPDGSYPPNPLCKELASFITSKCVLLHSSGFYT
jgi:hypothetical protein